MPTIIIIIIIIIIIMIVSVLDRSAGFYSGIFFMLNHYIHCKENRITFVLDTMEWLFKYNAGWEDYFENIDLLFDAAADNEPTTSRSAGVMQFFRHSQIIENFGIAKYRAAIREIYRYNIATRDYIAHVAATQLAEVGYNFDAVFIRRGDKLYDESAFIPTVEYFKLLMNRRRRFAGTSPLHIFLQTDDYNCVIEAQAYIDGYNAGYDGKHQPVQLFTLCRRENTGGMIIFPRNLNETIKYNASAQYVSENIAEYAKRRSVYEYTPPEIYEHTLEMIAGVDFVLRSRICVLDLQSNVSRFIRLMRDDNDEPSYTTTLDIAQLETDPQNHDRRRNFSADNMVCPAFASSIYPDNFVVANTHHTQL